jgi:hypothetical protein
MKVRIASFRDYRINRRKFLSRTELNVNKLREIFGGMKVDGIGTSMINAFVEKRLNEGATNAPPPTEVFLP